jgi:cyclopropane-fatty-acyl-phospholipid synthase
MTAVAQLAPTVARGPTGSVVEARLASAGIGVGGVNPWDIVIHDERVFARVRAHGTLGLGESYMDGWWDCAALDEFAERAVRIGLKEPTSLPLQLTSWWLRLANRQSLRTSRRVADVHYDLGNELFARMLGPTMTYSCGYWPAAESLDQAQDRKHDLICDKLGLTKEHRLLDIGCGWGRLIEHAVRRTNCRAVGITISAAQHRHAVAACRGMPIEVVLADYRDAAIEGSFDRIASVGMFEHVGKRNHRAFFARAASLLADDGLFLLHTIGSKADTGVDPWVDRYIFPNSAVPCVRDIAAGIDEHFVLEDWHTFGDDYDRTLMAWAQRFEAYAASPAFPFDQRFYRMWRYYLYTFAGAFRARNSLQLWQIVLSKKGTRPGYRSVR